jgi:hypothetical protein
MYPLLINSTPFGKVPFTVRAGVEDELAKM